MAKKKKDHKRPDKTQSGKEKKQHKTTQDREEEENEYGGIPSRDLRKNLGCGG